MSDDDVLVLPEDETAARPVTVDAWQSRTGRLFVGDDVDAERIARWDGATHVSCNGCSVPVRKHYTLCTDCRAEWDRECWSKLPRVEWDERTPLAKYRGDLYFWDVDDVAYYCYEHDIHPTSLMLVLCQPEYAYEIDPNDYYVDILCEDQEVPDWLSDAFDQLNQTILGNRQPDDALSWSPTDTAVVLDASVVELWDAILERAEELARGDGE